MKYIFLPILVILSNVHYSTATDSQENQLTAEEKSCYDWFVETQKSLPTSPYKALSIEDRDVYQNRISFDDNPDAVIRSRRNYAESFYTMAEQSNISTKYDKIILQNAFLKMAKTMHQKKIDNPTDEVGVRMWVYSKALTTEEQQAWMENNYLKNPQEAEKSVLKFSKLVTDELVKLKLVEDSESAKTQKTNAIFTEKLNLFKKSYSKDQ